MSIAKQDCHVSHARVNVAIKVGRKTGMLVLGLGLERQVLVNNRRQALDCQFQS